ncbi:thioesterase family protein [Diaporthe amygdali]|uniref:thioesterase family protein n=1 Tax=Phomopsis amygdali TaxID=1214568 RepID=UPI0022FEAF2B|nr:thioesterase family protein [Diaporthe amygdali]KAJ0107752.1 thioesterase family protein [Diaporthe amygdali]
MSPPKSIEKTLSREENRRRAMAAVQAIFDRYKLVQAGVGLPAFDNATMANCTVVDASIGPPHAVPTNAAGLPAPEAGVRASCTTRLLIGAELGNYNGVMHGGAAGVIFDMLTTIALGPVARPGFWTFLGGVTRTLNISYLKAVPIGTTVIVHSYVYQVGRQTAYIKGWMTSEDGKTTYAVCDHHKIHVPTPAGHLKLKVPWDEQWDEDGKEKTASKL